jgi:lipopolysaccharide transport system ATP-binding protein
MIVGFSSDVAIRVERLSKSYRIGSRQEKYRTMRDTLAGVISAPARRVNSALRHNGNGKAGKQETIWALKDVSFEVKRGEVVGVIGRNGAGKSTLLKILSRITDPTSGYAEIHGRVGSLLEVGTGFHPELTGRENIYLNGAILGMKRTEMAHLFDEIVDFAEVETFIDTPVKHFSSGMYLRLAFAVAAHLNTEILLVDEVLAVGDVKFQEKCLGKMGNVAHTGRTVFLVSHNMAAITQLCERCLVFDHGTLIWTGNADSGTKRYLNLAETRTSGSIRTADFSDRSGTGEGRISSAEIHNTEERHTTTIGTGEPFSLVIRLDLKQPLASLVFGLEIRSPSGILILNLRSDSQGLFFGPFVPGETVVATIAVPGLPLVPGPYKVEPWFASKLGQRVDHLHSGLDLTLVSQGRYQSEKMIQNGKSLMLMDCEWHAAQEVDCV